jgi:hypothetical protein
MSQLQQQHVRAKRQVESPVRHRYVKGRCSLKNVAAGHEILNVLVSSSLASSEEHLLQGSIEKM